MSKMVAIETSPASILASLRGVITDARIAYPAVLHLEVRGAGGETWRFATQDAEWSPREPEGLIGCSLDGAEIDELGTLRFEFLQRSSLVVTPASHRANDDPPAWEVITPDGLHLEFGPGLRWQIGSADPASMGTSASIARRD